MSGLSPQTESKVPTPRVIQDEAYAFLTEEAITQMVDRAEQSGVFTEIIRTLGRIFFDYCALKQSFPRQICSITSDGGFLKETKRSHEIEEKDIDSSEERRESVASTCSEKDDINMASVVDLDAVRRSFGRLFKLKENDGTVPAVRPLSNILPMLFSNLELEIYTNKLNTIDIDLYNVILIILELPMLEFPDLLNVVSPLCSFVVKLPHVAQAKLAKILSIVLKDHPDRLKSMVQTVQQLITTRMIHGVFNAEYIINEDAVVCDATKFLRIFYTVNILAGDMEPRLSLPSEMREDKSEIVPEFDFDLEDLVDESRMPESLKMDLLVELGIDILDCRKPLIEEDEFYNELLSEQLHVELDYRNYRSSDSSNFSFLCCPFILTPYKRIQAMYLDHRMQMSHHSFLSILSQGEQQPAVLKLSVRRDHIVEDALINLELVTLQNPSDLKKQLVVEFQGEQGVDEGGVSKEFFQLIVEQIFNPDFGMFTLDEDTHTYWFNPTSFEAEAQFSLIGIVISLAIYNNVILDVHFPMVVYRKLFGARGTYRDLLDYSPSLARGLHQLLIYKGDDIVETFEQTFMVNYKDVFGNTIRLDLKPDGDQIVVDHSNKVEFVELYADYLLNKSVERQFAAFKKGFDMVTRDSSLTRWFSPEEIELLVCGQKDFDLNGLQGNCEYDGYSPDAEVVKWFWEVVHEMDDDQKKQLLQFTTGSDRVPVGGLSKLRMIITRHGPDTDRLPSSHTCFNVLLLPEYSSKEKLQERLLKAITYSKGFGLM